MASAAESPSCPSWKMPGYTGYVRGLGETFSQTPVYAQLVAAHPAPPHFLHVRGAAAPVPTPARDPCNHPERCRPGAAHPTLWPSLQQRGKQDSAKPPVSQLTLGDGRVHAFQTSYAAEFAPPFASGACLRSPLRNQGLAEATTDLRAVYRSAFQRTGEKRLDEMLGHMKERIGGKIGNQNNNAFKLRKLFAMYDTQKTGLISVEAFRVMTESFGMQLDDDLLLALFSRYDPEASGTVRYHTVMKALLDSDSYAQYAAGLHSA
ncbi:hypothetical protein WJX81_006652 [Elliptochloris bilobata]|uniref:EF-hand domain-containing protein n=1 Tax=Elliptochloris bilobata TaxID=381761 RepID=A0AAW1SDT2_9CHLO